MKSNRAVKVFARDDRITSDARILVHDADHRLGLPESLVATLENPRQQNMSRRELVGFLRECSNGLSPNYAARDVADRLTHDPAM